MTILNAFNVNKENYIPGKFVDIDIEINQNINVHKMRPNQEEIYKYKDKQHFIMSQPSGAGKSTSIKFVVNSILQENPNLKVVIAVPQTLISKTFSKVFLEYPDGSQAEWDISHNLCEPISEGRKTSSLRNFLLKKRFSNDLSDRIILVTHQTLSKLSTKIDFDNVIIIIDEGHHVLYPENEELETANKIGKVVSHLMNQNNSTVKVWFATATFFRGDKSPIIPFEEMSKFTSYYLPLDEYWKDYIKYIQSFSYNFVIYKNNDIFNEVKEILKGKRKTIIYCPYNGNLIKGSNKIQFCNKLIDKIKSVWNDCRILDLIDEDGRLERKQVIIDNTAEFDIVLAARLFDEGTDWPYAEDAIDLYPSNSLRVQFQRFGRLLRDLLGKTYINYYAFFPFEARFNNEDDRRVHLSKSVNALIASSLLHDVIEPVPYLYSGTVTQKKNKSDNVYQVDPFKQEVPDESKKQEILNAVIKNLVFLKNIEEEPNAKECIIRTLESFGVKNNLEEVSVYIAKILRRSVVPRNPTWDQQTIDVSWMVESGFDKVWSDDIYTGILSFTTGSCGISTFQEFREVYSSKKTPEEWVKFAENLAKENSGILPSTKFLLTNNYRGLVVCLYRHPESFQHIPQEKERVRNTPEEWVIIAEILAEENGGVLPRSSNLANSLVLCLSRRPELFQHIPREKGNNTPEEWVIIAEILAEENGGVLPSNKTLVEHYHYNGLETCLYTNPELFQHIPREKLRNTPEEWVIIAENLAKENSGILPKPWHLTKHYNYSGLVTCLQNHPELFQHIPQEKGKTKEEWVIIAKNLTKENGGVLPKSSVLLKHHNYKGLDYYLRTNPKLFKGMKQYFGQTNKIITIGEE